MAYGLKIVPSYGGKAVIISDSSKVLGNTGYYKPGLDSNGRTATPVDGYQPGNNVIIIPRKTIQSFIIDGAANRSYVLCNDLYFDGSNIQGRYKYALGQRTIRLPVAEYEIWQVSATPTTQRYGLAMYNSTDFSSITDATKIGMAVWSGTITLGNGAWRLPAGIPNVDSCLIFANWNDPTQTLWYDKPGKQIRHWYSPSGDRKSIPRENTGSVVVRIVIISSGFFPPNPSSRWGLVIRNAYGQNVYSSEYLPMIWRGATWTSSSTPGQYTGPSQAMMGQMMIPLSTNGVQMLGEINLWHWTGQRMSNGSATSWGGYQYEQNNSATEYDSLVTSIPTPVLDTADYF